MNNNWLKIILAASLAFNIAFVANTLYKKMNTHERKRLNEIASDSNLKLEPKQKEEIQKIIKKFKIELLEYKQDILDKRIDIIEAMSDTEFNMETIESRTTELNRLETQLNLLFVDTLIKINTLLEPSQRLTFLYKLSENWFFVDKGRKTKHNNK